MNPPAKAVAIGPATAKITNTRKSKAATDESHPSRLRQPTPSVARAAATTATIAGTPMLNRGLGGQAATGAQTTGHVMIQSVRPIDKAAMSAAARDHLSESASRAFLPCVERSAGSGRLLSIFIPEGTGEPRKGE